MDTNPPQLPRDPTPLETATNDELYQELASRHAATLVVIAGCCKGRIGHAAAEQLIFWSGPVASVLGLAQYAYVRLRRHINTLP